MKWLLIQSAGVHKENQHMRECHSLKRAIEFYGWECDIIGKRFPKIDLNKEYDIVIMLEQYEKEDIPDIRSIKCKHSIQWIIDLHCQMKEFYQEIGKYYQIVLHSTKDLIQSYSDCSNQKHIWFPNAVDDYLFSGQGLRQEKIINMGFIGSKIPKRDTFIDSLAVVIPIYRDFRIGNEMIEMISKMKIHFNFNIANDINYRTFETIGLGTCLMTNYDPKLFELGFINKENCLMYKTKEEAIQLYWDFIGSNEWRMIAYNGYMLSKEHTYVKRIRYLLEQIGEGHVFSE